VEIMQEMKLHERCFMLGYRDHHYYKRIIIIACTIVNTERGVN
jgi:hypothetical protein